MYIPHTSPLPVLIGAMGLLMTASGYGERITAAVTAVPEGGVLIVKHDGKAKDLRLYGLDCPESGQPHAEEARQFVSERVLTKEVALDILTTDNQGKAVATVFQANGVNLNHALVRAGLAWWDREHAPKDRELRRRNAKAIEEGVGLWSETVPLAPWDYRQSHGLPQFDYSIEAPPASESQPERAQAENEQPRSISAKGNAVYRSNFTVDAGAIAFDNAIDPGQFLMRHKPSLATDANGNVLGLAVANIAGIEGATALGFRDGDIVAAVNGTPITSEAQVLGLIRQFGNAKQRQIRVDVLRGGQPATITINVP